MKYNRNLPRKAKIMQRKSKPNGIASIYDYMKKVFAQLKNLTWVKRHSVRRDEINDAIRCEVFQTFYKQLRPKANITTQSVASPRTPHLSMITILTFTFELWPPKSIGFTMVNMSAKFHEEAHNGFVCIRFTAYFHTCPLWPWPLTSKINRVHPCTKVNISAKFDEEIHNGLVSIVFISLFPYMSIVTLTFDLWPTKSIGLILLPWLTCLPSLIKKQTTV